MRIHAKREKVNTDDFQTMFKYKCLDTYSDSSNPQSVQRDCR